MRYAIMADIHANLNALEVVLDDVERTGGAEEIWCLGDIVGYGANPGECILLLRQYKMVCVAGNHDLAAIGKIDTTDFNPMASRAARWTTEHLSGEEAEYLKNLPLIETKGDFTLLHGSPNDPIWEYITTLEDAKKNFTHFNTRYCLVGHTHVPAAFGLGKYGAGYGCGFLSGREFKLVDNRLIINPGGVGQPRDGDPRASYAIYDSQTNTIQLRRVDYDIAEAQKRIKQANLPLSLATRLSEGW
ncbi:metallophosphoesterase family protein [Chloroflexota bacterium]